MRIPLTKYGMPQVVILPGLITAVMILIGIFFEVGMPFWAAEIVLAIVLVWALAFFRDPHRHIADDGNVLLAPADGTISDIEAVTEDGFINGPAIRVGIFLSVFNVHINRAPCNVKVEEITYKKGFFKNAMSPESGRVNESNNLKLVRVDEPADKLIVRQISGAIARRIVCRTAVGEQLSGGEKFGMIKFGSRTELYVSAGNNIKCLVKKGDKVNAGVTALFRYDLKESEQ